MHNRGVRRHNDWKKAIRKHDICEKHYGFEWYDNLHQYSKNKIHCSCPMCRSKIKNKQMCGPTECWPMQDRKRFDDMEQQLEEYMEDEE